MFWRIEDEGARLLLDMADGSVVMVRQTEVGRVQDVHAIRLDDGVTLVTWAETLQPPRPEEITPNGYWMHYPAWELRSARVSADGEVEDIAVPIAPSMEEREFIQIRTGGGS